MALQGALCDMNLSCFSLKSNTTAMEMMRAMAKTYVPRNFLMMYMSSRFKNPPVSLDMLTFSFGIRMLLSFFIIW